MLYNATLMKISLFLARVLNAYSLLIWVRIIFSWFISNPQRNNFVYWLGRLVDPYLSVFKSKKSTIGRLDYSPIFAIGVIYIFECIFQFYGVYGTLTLSSVLYIFLNAFWAYGLSIFFWVLFFSLVFKTIASFSNNPQTRMGFYTVGSAAEPVTQFVRQMAGKRLLSEKTVNIISLVLVIVFYFMTRYLVGYLASLCMRIPF